MSRIGKIIVVLFLAVQVASVCDAKEATVTPQQTKQAVALLRAELERLPQGVVYAGAVHNALEKAPDNPELKFAKVLFDTPDEHKDELEKAEHDWLDSIGFREVWAAGLNIRPLLRDWQRADDRASFAILVRANRHFAQEVPGLMKYMQARHSSEIDLLRTKALEFGNSPMMQRLLRAATERKHGQEEAYRSACIPIYQRSASFLADFYTFLDAHYDELQFQGDWKKASTDPAVQQALDALVAKLDNQDWVERCTEASQRANVKWEADFRKAVSGTE